jgi:hypothetical protein
MTKGFLRVCFEDGKNQVISLDGAVSIHLNTNDRIMDMDLTKLEIPKTVKKDSAPALHIDSLVINA